MVEGMAEFYMCNDEKQQQLGLFNFAKEKLSQ